MNPRRVHELMRQHFPTVEHAARDWFVVQDERGANVEAIASLLAKHIGASEVVIEIHRKLGALLPMSEAPAYIGAHVGQGEIRIADPAFRSFAVVAVNGVATAWSQVG